MGLYDDAVDAVSGIKDRAMSTVKDLAAKGKTIRNTMPARPSGIDVGKLAEAQRDHDRPEYARKKQTSKSPAKRATKR